MSAYIPLHPYARTRRPYSESEYLNQRSVFLHEYSRYNGRAVVFERRFSYRLGREKPAKIKYLRLISDFMTARTNAQSRITRCRKPLFHWTSFLSVFFFFFSRTSIWAHRKYVCIYTKASRWGIIYFLQIYIHVCTYIYIVTKNFACTFQIVLLFLVANDPFDFVLL